MSKQLRPTVVYLHLGYCFVVLAFLLGGIFSRHSNPSWTRMPDVRMKYDLYNIAISLYTLAVVYGLLRMQRWGRFLAIAWNLVVVFLFLGLPIIGYGFARIVHGEGVTVIHTESIVISSISICFVWRLLSKSLADRFR